MPYKDPTVESAYKRGYAAGKVKAHSEIRNLGGHSADCHCEPCKTVRIVQSMPSAPRPAKPVVVSTRIPPSIAHDLDVVAMSESPPTDRGNIIRQAIMDFLRKF